MELCDFLAEDELFEIVPNFKADHVLKLITGNFGPFKPAIPLKVPLWMAINLLKQQKCKIILPEWIVELDKISDEQKGSTTTLIEMPNKHWREILNILVKNQVDFPTLQSYLHLEEIRDAILKKSVHTLLDNVVDLDEDKISQIKIKNITKFELVTIKELILENLSMSKSFQ